MSFRRFCDVMYTFLAESFESLDELDEKLGMDAEQLTPQETLDAILALGGEVA